ncbi:MAG: flagellin lysine-N-methylase, partial [Pygmaiobacter massiliensis]|nr:flagellin lysine-N-methylase [Pygmaiobacter massiliensis]
MKQRIPDYYPDFHCIGSACKDNCCIGWEIDIDPVAWEDYRSQPGAFGERLRAEIDTEGEPHFRLKEDERCPFLNEQNLCDIIPTLGAGHLCQICDRHPRFYTWLSDCTEAGLGLCCEEAARLILTHRTPVAFLEREAPMKGEQELPQQQPDQWENHLLAARQRALMILQNRTLPIESRVLLLLQYGEELQS